METESQIGIQECVYVRAMETPGPRPPFSSKCHSDGIELRAMVGLVSGVREVYFRGPDLGVDVAVLVKFDWTDSRRDVIANGDLSSVFHFPGRIAGEKCNPLRRFLRIVDVNVFPFNYRFNVGWSVDAKHWLFWIVDRSLDNRRSLKNLTQPIHRPSLRRRH